MYSRRQTFVCWLLAKGRRVPAAFVRLVGSIQLYDVLKAGEMKEFFIGLLVIVTVPLWGLGLIIILTIAAITEIGAMVIGE